jgi:excisionase family DNA binding protein
MLVHMRSHITPEQTEARRRLFTSHLMMTFDLSDEQVAELFEHARTLDLIGTDEPSSDDAWLSTKEAAVYVGLSEGTLNNDASRGGAHKIPFHQPSGRKGRRRYRRSELDAYLKEKDDGS